MKRALSQVPVRRLSIRDDDQGVEDGGLDAVQTLVLCAAHRRSEGRSIPMSRTDMHRPYMVLLKDQTIRSWFKDHHSHETGSCDLEMFLTSGEWIRTRCSRQITAAAPSLCGCAMCSPEQAWAGPAMRTQWRQIRQQLLKTSFEDLDEELDLGRSGLPSGFVPRRMLKGQYYIVTNRNDKRVVS